jgi:hypothetical protein
MIRLPKTSRSEWIILSKHTCYTLRPFGTLEKAGFRKAKSVGKSLLLASQIPNTPNPLATKIGQL